MHILYTVENDNDDVKNSLNNTLDSAVEKFRVLAEELKNNKDTSSSKNDLKSLKKQKKDEEYWEEFSDTFDNITSKEYATILGDDFVKISSVRRAHREILTKVLFSYILFFGALNLSIVGIYKNKQPIKKGVVVNKIMMRNDTVYSVDFDGNPYTIESLLYLNNKKDSSMIDKMDVGSKVEMRSYKKEKAKHVYKIDNLVVKQR